MKKLIFTFFLCLLAAVQSAWGDFTYTYAGQTLTYEVLSSTDKTAGVADYPSSISGAVEIPATVTDGDVTYSVTSIGNYAFLNCSRLTGVTIPASVTSIGDWAFSGCSGLTGVTIPASVTSIGEYAFYDCSGLTEIDVSASNTKYQSIDGILYSKTGDILVCCPGGKKGSVTIPASVTSIEKRAFQDCSGLTGVTIPASVTSIGDSFDGCSGLTSVTIPASVTSIGDLAFSGCSGLKRLTCYALTPPSLGGSYVFYNVGTDVSVIVCQSAVDTYKAADGWKNFSNYTSVGTPTITLAAANKGTCDNAALVLPTVTIDYHAAGDSVRTWLYAMNEGAYSTFNPDTFSLSKLGGTTLTIKCAASNACGTVADSMMLRVNKSVRVAIDSTVCDSVLWNGKSCYQSGTYTFNGVTATGCDSIVTMNLRVNKSVRVAIDSTVNKGIVWNKMACDTTGDYVYNGVTATGCDSIVTLHLTVKPATPSAVSVLTSEEGAAFVVTAMPNPARANENFVVMVKGLGSEELSGASLMVYAENGRLVYGAKGVSAANAVSLPCGNYVAVVTTAGGRRTQCKVLVRP